jgi:hypothetical protein
VYVGIERALHDADRSRTYYLPRDPSEQCKATLSKREPITTSLKGNSNAPDHAPCVARFCQYKTCNSVFSFGSIFFNACRSSPRRCPIAFSVEKWRLEHPPIRRLTPFSRHQLQRIAPPFLVKAYTSG